MLCGDGTPDPAALHPGLYRFIEAVDVYCMRSRTGRLSASTVALMVVLWMESYPKAVPYKVK
jgi:hypothetical protein